jgi:hypothetical protein
MNQAPTKDESCPYSKSLTKGVFDESDTNNKVNHKVGLMNQAPTKRRRRVSCQPIFISSSLISWS